MQGLADAIGNGCNINLRCKFKSDTISVAGLLCLSCSMVGIAKEKDEADVARRLFERLIQCGYSIQRITARQEGSRAVAISSGTVCRGVWLVMRLANAFLPK